MTHCAVVLIKNRFESCLYHVEIIFRGNCLKYVSKEIKELPLIIGEIVLIPLGDSLTRMI